MRESSSLLLLSFLAGIMLSALIIGLLDKVFHIDYPFLYLMIVSGIGIIIMAFINDNT